MSIHILARVKYVACVLCARMCGVCVCVCDVCACPSNSLGGRIYDRMIAGGTDFAAYVALAILQTLRPQLLRRTTEAELEKAFEVRLHMHSLT